MNFNPMDMLKNFQGLQSKMADFQAKLATLRIIGSSGAGMVTVEMDGNMHVLDVKIQKEAIDPNDTGLTEELVMAAMNDAVEKMREKINEEVSAVTGGLNLPEGFPFGGGGFPSM